MRLSFKAMLKNEWLIKAKKQYWNSMTQNIKKKNENILKLGVDGVLSMPHLLTLTFGKKKLLSWNRKLTFQHQRPN